MNKREALIMQKRFDELDLRIYHNKEIKTLFIYPMDGRKGNRVGYENIKTKEDIIRSVNDYIGDYLNNLNMTKKIITKKKWKEK